MYQSLIEDFLTHYQPDLKAALIEEESMQEYINTQAQAMTESRSQIMEQLRTATPSMSQTQLELEADQTVRGLYLTFMETD